MPVSGIVLFITVRENMPAGNYAIEFENEEFKIKVCPNRLSIIDNVDDFYKVFHEEIEIKYFIEGSSTLHIGNESVVTEPGDIVFINPFEFHSTVNYAEEKGKYHLLMIGLDFFASDSSLLDLRYLFMNERGRIQTLIKNDEYLGLAIRRIVEEVSTRGQYYELSVKALVLDMFTRFFRLYKDPHPASSPSDKRIKYYEVIYPAIKMIRENCSVGYSVDELSGACKVSKCHFCRIFKESTSMSVVEYRNEYRLQIARVLIKTTAKSISEISVQCGFDDMAYFSRCYKKRFGHSPMRDRAILSK